MALPSPYDHEQGSSPCGRRNARETPCRGGLPRPAGTGNRREHRRPGAHPAAPAARHPVAGAAGPASVGGRQVRPLPPAVAGADRRRPEPPLAPAGVRRVRAAGPADARARRRGRLAHPPARPGRARAGRRRAERRARPLRGRGRLVAFVGFAGAALPLRMLLVALGVGPSSRWHGARAVRRIRPELVPRRRLPRPRQLAHALVLSTGYQLSIAGLLLGTLAATGHTLSPLAVLGRLRRQPARGRRSRPERRESTGRRARRGAGRARRPVGGGRGGGGDQGRGGLAAGARAGRRQPG